MPGSRQEPAAKRRRLFVRALVANGHDAAKAYRAVYGDVKGARQSAHAMLKMPDVQAELRRLSEKQLAQADITAERVMLELGRRAFSDIRQCFDADGNLLPIADLTDDAAAAIDGIEIAVDGKDDDAKTVKIRRNGKDAALGLLARHFKIAGHELDETVGKALVFAERMAAARERARKMRK